MGPSFQGVWKRPLLRPHRRTDASVSVEAASAARGDLNKAESFLRVLGGPGNAQGLLPLRMSGSQMPRVIEKKLLCMIPKCFLMKKKKKKKRPLVLLSVQISSDTFSVEKELGNAQPL